MIAAPFDLVLDIGNSRTKWAIFQQGMVQAHGLLPGNDAAALDRILLGRAPLAIAVGSTARPDAGLLGSLREIAPTCVLEGTSPSPLKSAYVTPNTLGADRLANAVAAVRRFPGRAVLVIDAGTCITYDLCAPEGIYLGGAISPGLHMRAAAMNAYSARLPLVEVPIAPPFIGTNTTESLASGIHHGIRGEMQGYIQRAGTEHTGMAVVITGGDALRFARALESGIFALPLLTLEGYHALLDHHRTLHGGILSPDAGAFDGPRAAG